MRSCATCGAPAPPKPVSRSTSFERIGQISNRRGVIGRFSTFLEHVKPNANAGGQSVTRYNALFHWKVAPGRELDAGREIGRHYVMTHAYWREGPARSFAA